jgi:hypothetical protein
VFDVQADVREWQRAAQAPEGRAQRRAQEEALIQLKSENLE